MSGYVFSEVSFGNSEGKGQVINSARTYVVGMAFCTILMKAIF